MDKRVTVYDVATRAGVSTATVSFAFAKPERVKATTLEHVLAVADELGYVPSASARGLASGRTGAIGLYAFEYLMDVSQPEPSEWNAARYARAFPLYSDEVQRGIELECREQGFALMIGSGRDRGPAAPIIDVAGRVDGIIAFALLVRDTGIDKLTERMPVVEFGGDSAGSPRSTVAVDNRGAMKTMVAHLLDAHGIREFGYLGPVHSPEMRARYEAFAESLERAGIPVPPATHSAPGYDDITTRAVEELLDSRPLPEAIVCSTDQEALVLLDLLAERRIRVPEDVIVTGFDGILAGILARPSLTTMRQPMEEIGRTAVRLLIRALDGGGGPEHRALEAQLMIGESCGCRGRLS